MARITGSAADLSNLDNMTPRDQDAALGLLYVAQVVGGDRGRPKLIVSTDNSSSASEPEVAVDLGYILSMANLEMHLTTAGWRRLDEWNIEVLGAGGLRLAVAVERA